MRSNPYRVCIFSLVFALDVSSLIAHSKDWGHPYAGTEKAAKGLPCGLGLSLSFLLLPAPFMIADVPLSLAVDALLLPADVAITPQEPRERVARADQYPGSCVNW